jgi:hypothetical protein
LNLSWIHFRVGSIGRLYSHEQTPRAKKFLQRLATLLESFRSSRTLRVIPVMSTTKTWYWESEPSSRGLVA